MKSNKTSLIGSTSNGLASVFNPGNLRAPGDSLKFSVLKDNSRLATLHNQNGKLSMRRYANGVTFVTFSNKP